MNEIAEWWSASPCEAWHGTAEVGSKEWSDQIRVHRYFVQPHIREFADFPRWKGKRVLEIGCGIGTDTLEFAKAGADIDAVELSLESRAIAMQRLEMEEFYRPIIWPADAEDFLPSGKVDLIYSFGVIHHTPNPILVLANARKRLKDYGQLRIMLYAKWSLKHLLGTQPEAQAGCPLVRWYSFRSARRLLESCGFEVTSIRKTHIFPWKIGPYKEHRFVKSFPWNICPEWLFRWLESKLGHHLLLVAKRGSNG